VAGFQWGVGWLVLVPGDGWCCVCSSSVVGVILENATERTCLSQTAGATSNSLNSTYPSLLYSSPDNIAIIEKKVNKNMGWGWGERPSYACHSIWGAVGNIDDGRVWQGLVVVAPVAGKRNVTSLSWQRRRWCRDGELPRNSGFGKNEL
jgi:hypothetical protein